MSRAQPNTGGVRDLIADADRALVIGIGGGGDVVGALAFAESARALGTASVLGGLTWERRVVDPIPGPRRLDEISGAQRLNDVVALAGPDTSGPGGFRFSEAAMASFLGQPVALVDPNHGPRAIGAAVADAAGRLACDLIVMLDVGGDVLAHGNEPGLASPLADAVMLAATRWIEGVRAIGCVFGAGCDGELTPAEVLERFGEIRAAGGLLGDLPLSPEAIERALASTGEVVTEASALALRCAQGETGAAYIRGGTRRVEMTTDGGRMVCFDPAAAMRSTAALAAAVIDAGDLAGAHEILADAGVRTELQLEREAGGAYIAGGAAGAGDSSSSFNAR